MIPALRPDFRLTLSGNFFRKYRRCRGGLGFVAVERDRRSRDRQGAGPAWHIQKHPLPHGRGSELCGRAIILAHIRGFLYLLNDEAIVAAASWLPRTLNIEQGTLNFEVLSSLFDVRCSPLASGFRLLASCNHNEIRSRALFPFSSS